MRGISSGDKRFRDLDNPNDLPPSKKQKSHHDLKSDALNLLEFTDITNAEVRQDCINAREKILKFLRDNPESLDVSSLSPATLTAFPSGALGSAASAVKRLVLPEHLYSVPAICDEMPALQELILRDYSGRQLNLLKWVQLRQVSGSVSVITEDIYLNSTANISLITPRMTKLRCHRLLDNGDFRSHALPGQSYYKTLRGRSQPDLQSMNCRATFTGTDVRILCRHIAAYVLPHLQLKDIANDSGNGYLGISDLSDLPKKISQDLDMQFYAHLQSSRAYHCVSDSQFGLWASAQFKELQNTSRKDSSGHKENLSKSYYACSSNHSLVLVLRYKPDSDEKFVMIMMDPNQTLTHIRQSEHQVDQVQYKKFSNLIPPHLYDLYFFPDSVPSLLLVDSAPRAKNESPNVNWEFFDQGIENFFPIFLACGISQGIESYGTSLQQIYKSKTQTAISIFKTLTAASWKIDVYAIEQAVTLGYTETIKAHLQLIEDFLTWHTTLDPYDVGNQLPEDAGLHMILPSKSIMQMYQLTSVVYRPALHTIIDGISRLYGRGLISSEACLILLQDQFEDQTLMEAALRGHDEETVRRVGSLLCQLLSSGAIDFKQSVDIMDRRIGGPNSTSEPLSWTVLRDCETSMLEAYADLLAKLRSAAEVERHFAPADFLDWLRINQSAADEGLIASLLFPSSDKEAHLRVLQQQGDLLLAERLLTLTNRERLDTAPLVDFYFGNSEE
jgi:hypothetical protein